MIPSELVKRFHAIICELKVEDNIKFLTSTILGDYARDDDFTSKRKDFTRRFNELNNIIYSHNLVAEDKRIIELFGINEYINQETTNNWIDYIYNVTSSKRIWDDRNGLNKLSSLITFLNMLKKIDNALKTFLIEDKTIEINAEEKTFDYILQHKDNGYNINDIIQSLTIINELYKDVCKIENVSIDDLRIEYIESGSDMLMKIIGLINPINIVTNLVKSYDDIRFNRFEKGMQHFRELVELRDYIIQSILNGKLLPEEAQSTWDIMSNKILRLHGIEMSERYDVAPLLEEASKLKLLGEKSVDNNDIINFNKQ